jgi:hypothetical protein
MIMAAAEGTAIAPVSSKKRVLAGGTDSDPKRSEHKPTSGSSGVRMAGGNPVGEYGYYQSVAANPQPHYSITLNVSGDMAGTMSPFNK